MPASTHATVFSALLLTGWCADHGSAAPGSREVDRQSEASHDEAPRTHLVLSGLAWHLTAAEAKPGDQILLEKGFHISGRIEDLHGTRERPIVIRGADPRLPSAIACDETGIELIRCSWIRLENLYFINPTSAAIVIDGSPAVHEATSPSSGAGDPEAQAGADASTDARPDVSIAIAACRIGTSREFPGMDGIRVRHARNVGIAQCQFDDWSRAAVLIEDASAVVITRCAFLPQGAWHRPFGVRIVGDSRFIAVHQSTFERGMATGVQAGACVELGGREPGPSPARDVRVVRSLMLEVDCPLEVGPHSDATLTECTLIDPRIAYRLDASCGAPRLTIADSIIQWVPGRLRTIVDRRGEVVPEMVSLDRNLWWSEELPAGFEAVGHPFGRTLSPQVTDVDPKISDRLREPTEPKAAGFGWMASTPRIAGSAAPDRPTRVDPETTPDAAPSRE